MNPKLLVGAGIAAAAGIGLLVMSSGEAKAGEKTAPNGSDFKDLALVTTVAMTTQQIQDIKAVIQAWDDASDPITAGNISAVLDGALLGQSIPEWPNDGQSGSPVLRAYGLRVLNLEGRPARLLLWANAWQTILPKLSEALRAKAGEIRPDPGAGTTDDPIPPADLVDRIAAAVASGDTVLMRRLADELEALGFKEQAADLRAVAKAIDEQKVSPPKPPAPGPITPGPTPPFVPQPTDDDDEPVVPPPKPQPVPPAPSPVVPPTPAPSNGGIYVVLSGDNPSKIALKFTGNANRWPELVAANSPPKKKASNGNFATLNAGEKLKLPASWPQVGSPTAPSTPIAPTPSTGTYTVLSGDNPSKIAQKFTGNANRWPELVAANSPPKKRAANGNFATLNAGEKLKLPASWFGAPVLPKPSSPGAPALPPAPAPVSGNRIYTVASGDNPSKIAKKITGDPNRFRELVAANVPPKKKSADGGFTTLFPGEKLKVPASWPSHPEAILQAKTEPRQIRLRSEPGASRSARSSAVSAERNSHSSRLIMG